jgi:hypothetical protein
MPGKSVRNWPLYEALIAKGYSKEKAARIANTSPTELHRRRRSARRPVKGK